MTCNFLKYLHVTGFNGFIRINNHHVHAGFALYSQKLSILYDKFSSRVRTLPFPFPDVRLPSVVPLAVLSPKLFNSFRKPTTAAASLVVHRKKKASLVPHDGGWLGSTLLYAIVPPPPPPPDARPQKSPGVVTVA